MRVLQSVGWVICLCFFQSLAWAEPNAASEPVGFVMWSLGDAYVRSGTGQSRVATDTPVMVGQTLVTAPGAFMNLKMFDGAFLSLRPDTVVKIVSYTVDYDNPANNAILLETERGVVRSATGKGGKDNKQGFRLNTRLAAIGIRGTDFTVSALAQDTRVTVREGIVAVSLLSDTCPRESLGACTGGESVVLTAQNHQVMAEVSLAQQKALLIPKTSGVPTPDEVAPPHPKEEQNLREVKASPPVIDSSRNNVVNTKNQAATTSDTSTKTKDTADNNDKTAKTDSGIVAGSEDGKTNTSGTTAGNTTATTHTAGAGTAGTVNPESTGTTGTTASSQASTTGASNLPGTTSATSTSTTNGATSSGTTTGTAGTTTITGTTSIPGTSAIATGTASTSTGSATGTTTTTVLTPASSSLVTDSSTTTIASNNTDAKTLTTSSTVTSAQPNTATTATNSAASFVVVTPAANPTAATVTPATAVAETLTTSSLSSTPLSTSVLETAVTSASATVNQAIAETTATETLKAITTKDTTPVTDPPVPEARVYEFDRWQEFADTSTSKLSDSARVIATTPVHRLGSLEIDVPRVTKTGSTDFNLTQGEAVVKTGTILQAATIEDAKLNVNFDNSKFTTSMNVKSTALPTGSEALAAQGSLEAATGALASDAAVSSMTVKGDVSNAGSQAAYLFERDVTTDTLISGATLWQAQ